MAFFGQVNGELNKWPTQQRIVFRFMSGIAMRKKGMAPGFCITYSQLWNWKPSCNIWELHH